MLVLAFEWNSKVAYAAQLREAMKWLGEQEGTVFLGQAVAVPGTAMFNTLTDVPLEKVFELPVAEEMQMGMTIGCALNGDVPISVFPRWNFLLLAVNQLVNHLDRMPKISNGGYHPKVIIRTSVGSQRPLHPQFQHVGNFSEAFRLLLDNIDVVVLNEPEDIVPAYRHSYSRQDGRSTLLVEYGDYYHEK